MLRWEITNLTGFHLHTIDQHTAGEVEILFNDARTARVTVSLYDEAAKYAKEPAKTLLKAYYGDDPAPIFAGPILFPEFNLSDATVEISAQDPSWRLDRAPMLLNRQSAGNPNKYESLDDLVAAAEPYSYGFFMPPRTGIRSRHGEPKRKPMPIMELSRGESVWSVMLRCSKSVFGPDFAIRPIVHKENTLEYAELDIWTRRGRELQNDPSLVFHAGWGKNNCVDASFRPSGEQLVNTYYSGYSIRDSEDERVVCYWDPASQGEYGVIASYESSGCQGSAGKGIAQVSAYRVPPRFFTFQPAIEGYTYPGREEEHFGVPPKVFEDYDLGDAITVEARKGYFEERMVGRVTAIRLSEVDDAGNVQTEVTVVPRVGISGIESQLEDDE